eukprot:6175500-Pleurochrysis_carterae.AAC.7
MEGAKENKRSNTWSTAKMPTKKRWEEYRDILIRAKQPVVGSQSLFEKIWRKHTEIRQVGAKKHAKCDICGSFEVEMDSLLRNNLQSLRPPRKRSHSWYQSPQVLVHGANLFCTEHHRKELLGVHQNRVRTSAAGSRYPAVFQTDYLILQRPSCGFELHRVANRLMVGDAVAPILSFSTNQYTFRHRTLTIPTDFGAHLPRDNACATPQHWPRLHQIVRCRNLYRQDCRYDGVEEAKTVVRIAVSSLRELHRLYLDQVPPVPDTIPTTHTDCGQYRSGGRGRGGRGGGGSNGGGGRRGGGRGSHGWGSSSARQQTAQVGAGAAAEEPNEDNATLTAQNSNVAAAESGEQHQKAAAPRRRSQPERQARRKRARITSGLDSSDEVNSDGGDNVDSSDEENAHNNGTDDVGGDDEDDPPAPIPDGFTAVPWADGTSIAVG